jgi:hypothetical protein
MDELAATKTAVRTEMMRGRAGSLAAERVDQLLDDYQHALKRAYAARLADIVRAAGARLGHNTNLAFRKAAALLDAEAQR